MTLHDLRDLLLTISVPVYHLEPEVESERFIVWAESGQGQSVWAGNKKALHFISGSLHYATKTEYDPIVKTIQDLLNSSGISWRLVDIEYDKDTGYIIYEWAWTIC